MTINIISYMQLTLYVKDYSKSEEHEDGWDLVPDLIDLRL